MCFGKEVVEKKLNEYGFTWDDVVNAGKHKTPKAEQEFIYLIHHLGAKVDRNTRKKLMVKTAEYLEVPREIIERNKYGFCDAFRAANK